MTCSVSSSPTLNSQGSDEKKHVSWGSTTVVDVQPSCHIPEGCSKKAEDLANQLLSSKIDLRDALEHFEDGTKRVQSIKSLRKIISAAEGDIDPVSQKILRISHILLARAYVGFLSEAFLGERKIIESDPEMKQLYPDWKNLLNANSFFD